MADPQDGAADGLTSEQAEAADTFHRAGYSDAGIAGILAGQGYESAGHGNINPTAVNPLSGAFGVAQDLGARKQGLVQLASAEGTSPSDLGTQERYADSEMLGNADGGTELPVGDYLRGADDPARAGVAYIHNFERPGAAAEQTEDPAVAQAAAGLYPKVQARYAQERQDLDAAAALFDKANGPTGGGKFDHQPLPPTQRSPQPNSMQDAASAFDAAVAAHAEPDQDPYAKVTPGYDWGSMGSALAELPRGVLRGVANSLGLPADLGNWVVHYYAQHPRDAAQVGTSAEGMMLPPSQYDNLPAYDPNSQGYRLPLGSQDIQKMIRYATGINPAMQDTSIGGETLGHMGEFIGAGLSPGGLAHSAGEVADAAAGLARSKSLFGMLFHHVLGPAGISGGLDAGEWAVDKATGDQRAGEAAGIGARALLGAAAFGGLGGGGAAGRGMRAAQDFAENAPAQTVDRAFQATHGSNAPFEKAAAAANLAAGQPMPEGYSAPAALRTGSAPLQQLFFNLRKADDRMHNDFAGPGPGSTASRNISAMEGMRPEGDAQDAVTAVRNAQAARQAMLDTRVLQAKQAADQAAEIATRQGQLVPGGAVGQQAGFDLAQEYVNQLRAARDDAFAHADDQWDVARQQGFTEAQAPVRPMYSALEDLMGENIRLQQGANFPWEQVNDLYEDGRPRAMFTKLGARLPETVGGNQLFGDGTTLEQLKGIDSRLGNAIRMEQDAISSPGNRGNPTLLRNLNQVRGVVWKAIDDGAAASGNQVALRSAMDATAQAYQTFGHGLLARVLNEQGGATNAPKLLSTYLGNSANAIQAADMFKNAMAQRTGAAAARRNLDPAGVPVQGAAPQQQFSAALADWLRQDYLNTHGDLGAAAGQRWLRQRAGFFGRLTGNTDFDNLHSELLGYSQAQQALPRVEQEAKQGQAELERNAAQLFLGGDAGPRLDAVFKSPNPGAAMQGLIDDTLQHGSGQAFRGLQRMLFDRVMDEAMVNDPIRPNQTYYSGKVAQAFLDQNKVAFDKVRQASPLFQARLDRLVRTMALEDRGRMETGLRLPGTPGFGGARKGWSAAGSLATKAFQIAGANLGHTLLGGGHGIGTDMQIGSLSSQYVHELAGHIPDRISSAINKVDPMASVRQALQEAMFDPEKLRGLLAPVDKPNGQKWARQIEPWLRAVGVELPQPWLNPHQEPQPSQP